MNYMMIAAAALLSLGMAASASAGEGNGEPFPLSISIPADGRPVQVSTLPDTQGLPKGALEGTPAYAQAQSLNRWYAQQADHRFAQQQLHQTHHNG